MNDVVRLLMMQVREEQQLRKEALLHTVIRTPVPIPTDQEVSDRIEEVQQILKGVLK